MVELRAILQYEASPTLLQMLQLESCSRMSLLSKALMKLSVYVYQITLACSCAYIRVLHSFWISPFLPWCLVWLLLISLWLIIAIIVHLFLVCRGQVRMKSLDFCMSDGQNTSSAYVPNLSCLFCKLLASYLSGYCVSDLLLSTEDFVYSG